MFNNSNLNPDDHKMILLDMKSKLPPKLRQLTTVGALIKITLLLPAMLVLGIFIVLRPFVIIQVYKVHDWRIGHMVSTTQRLTYEVREWNITHRRKKICLYFFGSHHSANDYFKKVLRRQHLSLSNNFGFLIYYLSSKVKFLITETRQDTLDVCGLIINNRTELKFTKNEINAGNSFLETFGTDINGKFVCLNVRDSAYFSLRRSRKVAKHSSRDSDIANYVSATECLAEMGYTVFRMGALVNKSLNSMHPMVIDYATNGMRSEFLDLFLGAHCTFCVSTGTGWDTIPQIFRRPTLYVNLIPVVLGDCINRDLLIYPKVLLDRDSHNELKLNEICDRKGLELCDTKMYDEVGIFIRDMSVEELVQAVTEMAARVEGRFVPTEKQKSMQEKLRDELMNNPKVQPSPGYYPVRAEYASCFLEKYPNFLD